MAEEIIKFQNENYYLKSLKYKKKLAYLDDILASNYAPIYS
jgi:hypothetical protein